MFLLFHQYEQYEDIQNDKDISRDASTSLLFLQYEQYEDIKTDTMIKIYHVMLLRLYCFFNTNNMRTYKLIQR